ncbi:hypothetical protein L1887_10778 [Cichorium endivia]|nr:hypothetical protein L1887_10778 [Cichorium endivia]
MPIPPQQLRHNKKQLEIGNADLNTSLYKIKWDDASTQEDEEDNVGTQSNSSEALKEETPTKDNNQER